MVPFSREFSTVKKYKNANRCFPNSTDSSSSRQRWECRLLIQKALCPPTTNESRHQSPTLPLSTSPTPSATYGPSSTSPLSRYGSTHMRSASMSSQPTTPMPSRSQTPSIRSHTPSIRSQTPAVCSPFSELGRADLALHPLPQVTPKSPRDLDRFQLRVPVALSPTQTCTVSTLALIMTLAEATGTRTMITITALCNFVSGWTNSLASLAAPAMGPSQRITAPTALVLTPSSTTITSFKDSAMPPLHLPSMPHTCRWRVWVFPHPCRCIFPTCRCRSWGAKDAW